MDPERAWIFNGVVNKLFADAHTKNVNDVDMAVSALSTYNSLDDENFADGFAQDFEQAGKALGHPLDVDDIRNVENVAKDFADAHKSYGNVKATGLGLVTFNGEYLNTIRGGYAVDGTSTVYTGNTIDAKYHQAVGDYDDDYKAQVAQKEENYKLKNRQEFNDLLKNVFEPRKGVYNEVTIDFAQDELAEKIDAGGGDALHTVADNFSDAVERLDVEDAFKESGGIDTVYARTDSFVHDYYDYGLKEVSFEDVIRENSDALIQSGEKDVFTPETLAKNFDAIRQYSNEVQYVDGEDDYDFDEPVDVKDDTSAPQSDAVKFNNTVNALVEPRNKEYDEGIMALGFQSAYNKVNVSDEHFTNKIGENFIQASQLLELEHEVNQAGGQDVVVSQAQIFHDAHVNEDKEYSLVDVADENAKQLRASKDVNINEDNIIDSNKFESKVKTVWADSNKQFYDEDENDYQTAVDKPSNTMAGKNVDLLVNSLVPIRYNTKDGNQKLGALVYASKRGDVPDQKTKFDGSMVVNQYTKYGKLSHAQLVSLDSAKAIMAANGYGDMDDSAFDYAADKKYDYGKELLDRGHAMTFTANVFSPEGAKYGDFKFNPNPEKIGKSDVPFDVETHVEAVQAREEEHAKNLAKYKEKQASEKDEGLEP